MIDWYEFKQEKLYKRWLFWWWRIYDNSYGPISIGSLLYVIWFSLGANISHHDIKTVTCKLAPRTHQKLLINSWIGYWFIQTEKTTTDSCKVLVRKMLNHQDSSDFLKNSGCLQDFPWPFWVMDLYLVSQCKRHDMQNKSDLIFLDHLAPHWCCFLFNPSNVFLCNWSPLVLSGITANMILTKEGH